MLKYSPGPPLWRQMIFPCNHSRKRCSLAMALSTQTDPWPHQVPFSNVPRAFVLHAPTPFKTVWPGKFLEVQLPDDNPPSMHLSPTLLHLVYVISSHISYGCSPVSFLVLCWQYAYQTCRPSLTGLRVMNNSAKSPLFSNQNRSHLQACLLLSGKQTSENLQLIVFTVSRTPQHFACSNE